MYQMLGTSPVNRMWLAGGLISYLLSIAMPGTTGVAITNLDRQLNPPLVFIYQMCNPTPELFLSLYLP